MVVVFRGGFGAADILMRYIKLPVHTHREGEIGAVGEGLGNLGLPAQPCLSASMGICVCRVTGRGHIDINRISGYLSGKIVFYLMQVGTDRAREGVRCCVSGLGARALLQMTALLIAHVKTNACYCQGVSYLPLNPTAPFGDPSCCWIIVLRYPCIHQLLLEAPHCPFHRPSQAYIDFALRPCCGLRQHPVDF